MTLFKNIPSVEIVSIDLFDLFTEVTVSWSTTRTRACNNDHKRLDLPTGRGVGRGEGIARFLTFFVTPSNFSIYKIHDTRKFNSWSLQLSMIAQQRYTFRKEFQIVYTVRADCF